MIQGMSHISRYGSPSRYLSDLGSARSDRSDSSAAGAALLAFHELEATTDKTWETTTWETNDGIPMNLMF